MEWYLPLIWAALIGTAVAMYVILDGFDLGVGILFPFSKSERERDQMMNSVAPFWDGNETWLVLGGAGLFVAFPLAYSVIMPALYLPVIFMLLALIFRGVAFEFRWPAQTSKKYWNVAFAGGSLLAAFFQGVILGGLIQGITVRNGQFAGGAFDWATPFAFLVGAGSRRRLWPSRRNVARVANRRAGRGSRPPSGQVVSARRACRNGSRQSLDAGGVRTDRGALVQHAEHLFPLARPFHDGTPRARRLDMARQRARRTAVSCRDRPVSPRLPRPRDFEFSVSRAADDRYLAGGGVPLRARSSC